MCACAGVIVVVAAWRCQRSLFEQIHIAFSFHVHKTLNHLQIVSRKISTLRGYGTLNGAIEMKALPYARIQKTARHKSSGFDCHESLLLPENGIDVERVLLRKSCAAVDTRPKGTVGISRRPAIKCIMDKQFRGEHIYDSSAAAHSPPLFTTLYQK